MRDNNRKNNEMREVKVTKNYIMHPEGSVLIEFGNTKVICNATIEEKVPPFLKGKGTGWVTAEYSMLPRSTNTRNQREASKGKVTGRTMEIQRLIGRALRSSVNLQKLGERSIIIDCDVIQADGGTRTASITGGFVAMVDAFNVLLKKKEIKKMPIKSFVSAVSVGIVDNEKILDLCYLEDSSAQVDMNVVMTDKGEFIEVQGTGEESPFTYNEFMDLISLGSKGCQDLYLIQKAALGEELSGEIGK